MNLSVDLTSVATLLALIALVLIVVLAAVRRIDPWHAAALALLAVAVVLR